MRLSSRSVRVRLTVWYVATLALLLLAYAVGVFVFLRHTLTSTLDRQLEDDAEAAERLLQRTGEHQVAWRATMHAENDKDHVDPWIEAWSRSGGLLYRSTRAGQLTIPAISPSSPQQSRTVVASDGSRLRALTRTGSVDGLVVVLRVGRSEEYICHELNELVTVLALASPFAVGLAAFGGYGLARRALTPVDRMQERASLITAERLKERLPVDTDDELGRLATTFNDLLARLEESFEQMRRFTADASHELRTPLTAIRSVGEVGLRERRDANAYREVIGSMLEEVDRLTHLVDGLLALSRADAGDARVSTERFDLKGLAEDVCGHLGVLAEEKRQLLHLDAGDQIDVTGDRVLLRQAVINLLDNAIKYTPAGGSVRVRVHGDARTGAIEVADTGPGIAAEHRTRIFDRFYRVDPARSRELGGVGLGLSIARWAVEINGGRLEYEPGHPAGSTFRITLPREGGTHAERKDHMRFAAFMVIAVVGGGTMVSGETRTVDFSGDAVGRAPKGFVFGHTAKVGAPGKWIVQEEAGNKFLAQTDADATRSRFPVAVLSNVAATDVDLSVRFKPVSGRVDQAAGLVWRYRDQDNYYIVRANALEHNVVLYKVEDGRRTDLPVKGEGRTYGKKASVPSDRWSTLRVVARGARFEVHFNGTKLYEVEDSTFTQAGAVGLWTKADSVTQFDDLTVVTQ